MQNSKIFEVLLITLISYVRNASHHKNMREQNDLYDPAVATLKPTPKRDDSPPSLDERNSPKMPVAPSPGPTPRRSPPEGNGRSRCKHQRRPLARKKTHGTFPHHVPSIPTQSPITALAGRSLLPAHSTSNASAHSFDSPSAGRRACTCTLSAANCLHFECKCTSRAATDLHSYSKCSVGPLVKYGM